MPTDQISPSFKALNGRDPIPGRDFDPDDEMCQDDHDFLAGTGQYSDMVKARVLTREEKEQAAYKLAKRLAEKGIYAMYGGRKGHGFWLYRVGVEMAKQLLEAFDPEKFWGLADSIEETPIIRNNGEKSGNPCFWMFDDALKLAEVSVLEG